MKCVENNPASIATAVSYTRKLFIVLATGQVSGSLITFWPIQPKCRCHPELIEEKTDQGPVL